MSDEDPPTGGESANGGTNSKVVRLLDEYDLGSLGAELEARWTGSGDERASLRQLAAELNRELLRTAMQEAGLRPIDGEVENTHRLLTGDGVSPGDRTDARRRLERAGVDVEQLEADFVSRQAIHTYLTEVRGASHQASNGDPVGTAETHLQQLKHRISTVTDTKIARLRDTGHLSIGSQRVIVDIQVLCEECGHQYPLEDLFSAQACACDRTD